MASPARPQCVHRYPVPFLRSSVFASIGVWFVQHGQGVGRPVAEPSEESKADLIKLAQLYGQLGNNSAFDPVVREGQNARLASLGFTQATQGRSTIVILITETGDALRKCLIALDESTWAPYDFVFIAADRAMVIPPWLTETIEARAMISVSPELHRVHRWLNSSMSAYLKPTASLFV